ncbi:MAG: ATP-binding protein [Lentisphaeria bacterium]|nr:ATP-binding protein [Lentisphaeria bacterium]
MTIQPSENPGMIGVDCSECGKIYEIEEFRGTAFEEIFRNALEKERWCPECREKIIAEETREKAELAERLRRTEFKANLERNREAMNLPRYYVYDRQTGELFKEPPCRYVAQWLWRQRRAHVLLSGVTGTGKSTSACYVALKLAEELQHHVKYYTLGNLLSLWRSARKSEDPEADLKFLWRIFGKTDLTIIDEVIGKARISESGQELLFDILEAVNNGECRSRIWLLGNFYSGSIEAIFADPEPVRRRLQENFNCVRIDAEKKQIVKLEVYKK